MPVRRLLALGVLMALLAGCGGDGGDDPTTADEAATAQAVAASTDAAAGSAATSAAADATAPTLKELLGLPDQNVVTPDVAVLGGADFATGKTTRIPFAVLSKDGQSQVEPDGGTAEVYLAASADAPVIGPFPTTARSLEVPGAKFEPGIPTSVWTAEVELPAPGPYILVARYTVDGKVRSANSGLNVNAEEATPAVGSPAPPSETPTLASTNGDLAALTTADPPDRSLLEHSIADSVAAHAPFVVTFATPRFCTSRICGPIIDIVLDVQKRTDGTPMRFIHAEIYKDNDVQKGVSPWITEWGLISEPWVFVVDATGTVRAKFEGAVTADELEQAARAAL